MKDLNNKNAGRIETFNLPDDSYQHIMAHITSLQADVEKLQSAIGRIDEASREITEAKQSIYYLVAATDELRRICNINFESD